MIYKRLILGVVLLLGFGLTGLQAQESLNVTGGNASGNDGSVSYSVGQVAFQTHTGTNRSVAEGVQQPFEVSVITVIDNIKGIELSVLAYPNPVTDYLQLKVEREELKDLSFKLYDMAGKLLQSENIINSETNIVVSNLAPETYLVKVLEGNQEIKVFKIIKK